MGLRRVAACDQRRRRVLIEESLHVVGGEGEGVAERKPAPKLGTLAGNSYSDAAGLVNQPPSVAILASRPFTQVVVSLSCLVAVVGLLASYGHWQLWPTGTWQSALSCLDVQQPGSLAHWTCSLMLAAAAFQGLQIYRLRRHKTDDYRGRYRVWTWFPLVLFAMATAVATGVHRELTALIVFAIWRGETPQLVTLVPMAGVFLWLLAAVRLAFEMRINRPAVGFLAAATVGYLSGTIVAQIDVQPISQTLVNLISSALLMAGHWSVFVAVMSFGRHVYLDSQGLLPARAAKPQRARSRTRDAVAAPARTRRKTPVETASEPLPEQPAAEQRATERPAADQSEAEQAEADQSEAEQAEAGHSEAERSEADRADPPRDVARPVLRLGTRADDAEDEDSNDDDPTSRSAGERLSKTERRRLKKLQRQEQLRRAA